jgi:hypothetical protein
MEGKMLAILLVAAALAAYEPPTNLEMAEQAIAEACLSLPDSLLTAGFQSVKVSMDGDHQGNWLVLQGAVSSLEAGGVQVTSGGRDDAGAVTLRIRPMELSMSLMDAGRSWIFGSRRIDREFRCELSAELTDSQGLVVISMRSGASRADRVGFSELERLQGGGSEEWLTGGTPAAASGGILEPLVVTGVVASLIYLFYSSRAE